LQIKTFRQNLIAIVGYSNGFYKKMRRDMTMYIKHNTSIVTTVFFLATTLCFTLAPFGQALAGGKAKIKVMTQNQYLGADLAPLVIAPDAAAFNQALVFVLQTIGASNYPERVRKLAKTIAKSGADLVGLQEMWALNCTPTSLTMTDPCSFFGPAFNDHLEATMEALHDIDADYYVAATVQNLTIESIGLPVPGLPVFLDDDGNPDVFVTVMDRDVILARNKVVATPVSFDCPRRSLDGCNYETVAETIIGGIPLKIERGFVAVDAVIKGKSYRFVNTHLEVRFPDPANPYSRYIQSAQASELIGTLAYQPSPPNSRLLIVGDINSDPDDPYPSLTTGPFLTPYQQFVSGMTLAGAWISDAYNDVWTLQRKPKPGLTCCEAADLRNPASNHDRRVDMIFSLSVPKKVKAKALNTKRKGKAAFDLWPSDHASVLAKFEFSKHHN
jgi:endonuclease/exonuclease/phosphatase family metal-dependent hydrolase